MLGKYGGKRKMDWPGWGQGPTVDCYGHGNKPSGTIKGGEFLD
jgi:hypothetical protein